MRRLARFERPAVDCRVSSRAPRGGMRIVSSGPRSRTESETGDTLAIVVVGNTLKASQTSPRCLRCLDSRGVQTKSATLSIAEPRVVPASSHTARASPHDRLPRMSRGSGPEMRLRDGVLPSREQTDRSLTDCRPLRRIACSSFASPRPVVDSPYRAPPLRGRLPSTRYEQD